MTDTPTRLTEEQLRDVDAHFCVRSDGDAHVVHLLLAEIDALRADRDAWRSVVVPPGGAMTPEDAKNLLKAGTDQLSKLWAERDRLLAHGARLKEALAQAVVVVNAEHLDDPQEGTDDDAYEMAVDDCERALRKHVREALASSETGEA